jgi:WD40 repeat protein
MLDHVIAADFSPDGQMIAAIVAVPGAFSLQYPVGTERWKTNYPLSHVRVAPDGEQLAFLSHPLGGDEGDVRVLGKTGEPRTISTGWITLGGLAWAKGGKELWFTGERRGGVRALWAVTLDGRERELYRSTESLALEDVAPDGRALLSAGSVRSRIAYGSMNDTADRDLAWFDFAVRPSLSGDGKLVTFTEAGEGAGGTYGIFVRPTNGDAAVRVTDGGSGIISPDGTQVLAFVIPDVQTAILAPTGAGEPKRISLKTLEQVSSWCWFPDGRYVLVLGNEPGHQMRDWRLDTATGKLEPITPEGARARVVSPNGRLLPVAAGTDRYLFDLSTGSKIPAKGTEATDVAIGFTGDSSAIYVFQPDPQGGRIFRIEISSGVRTLVRALHPSDPAGLTGLGTPMMSLDGEHFAYSVGYLKSQLFLLKGPQ